MSVKIENQHLSVRIAKKGAELASVVNKANHLGYLWDGNPAFWGKTSPVLFPIVGTLKQNRYRYNDQWYSMSRHGFARDHVFTVEQSARSEVVFKLTDTPATLEVFPFHFELYLKYKLAEAALHVTYEVKNTGDSDMYFSIGGHPAFRVPMTDVSRYEDHYLEFGETEDADHWPITADGLIDKLPLPLLNNSRRLNLTRGLFAGDALVLKDLKSTVVSLGSDMHDYRVEFRFEGFPYLGIWAAPGADFVCIEPWCGIADSVTSDQEFIHKEGIETLAPGGLWSRTWKAAFY